MNAQTFPSYHIKGLFNVKHAKEKHAKEMELGKFRGEIVVHNHYCRFNFQVVLMTYLDLKHTYIVNCAEESSLSLCRSSPFYTVSPLNCFHTSSTLVTQSSGEAYIMNIPPVYGSTLQSWGSRPQASDP